MGDGVYTISAARRHLSSVTSSTVPCSSGTSMLWLSTWIAGSRMALTSRSLLELPVMKLTMCRAAVGVVIFVAGFCAFLFEEGQASK